MGMGNCSIGRGAPGHWTSAGGWIAEGDSVLQGNSWRDQDEGSGYTVPRWPDALVMYKPWGCSVRRLSVKLVGSGLPCPIVLSAEVQVGRSARW
jgi:hypothetical protein